MSSEVLTTREAALFLKIHEKTLCRLARHGKIPGNKVGGEWRFMRGDLVQWIQRGNPTIMAVGAQLSM